MKRIFLLLFSVYPILSFSQNNDFNSASPFNAGNTVSATISNQPLYYETVLPVQGTMKITISAKNTGSSAGYLKAEVYDSRKSDLLLSQNIQKSSVAAGEDISDVLTISCLAAQTIYVKLTSSSPFSFQFLYTMEDTGENDSEDNNTIETPSPIDLDNTYKGTIGHILDGVRDDADYYKLEMEAGMGGKFSLYVEGMNTGNINGDIKVTFYQMIDGHYLSEEGSKVIETSSAAPGQIVNDSLLINCMYVYDGFIYVKVESNACFNYSLQLRFEDQKPNADFTFQKIANKVMFKPVTTDISGNNFLWRFGEEPAVAIRQMGVTSSENFYETSNSPFPFISLPTGIHKISLEISSKECYLNRTAVKYITIEGIEDYFPKKASLGGDFDLSITGWKFDETTELTLRKGTTIFSPYDLRVNSGGAALNALFDFHLGETGYYDVIVKVAEKEDPYVIENGLEISSLDYPETYSEIVGSDIWRTTSQGNLSLAIHNKGSVVANGVVAALIWPKDIEIEFEKNIFDTYPKSGSETVEVDGETFTLPRSDYSFIYDSLNKPTPIDSFNLQPYDGYVKYILVPYVPANGHIEIPFIARSRSQQAGFVNFHTYTFKTNQRGSCDNPVYANFNENLTAELIDGIDMVVDKSGVVPLKVLSKTAKIGQKHAGSAASYLGKKFWAWYDGYEFDSDGAMRDWLAETEANNAFAIQTATDEIGSLVFDVGSAKMLDRYKGQVDFVNKRLAANPNMSAALTEKYLDKLNSLPHDQMRRLETLKGIFSEVKNAGTLSDKLVKLQKLVDDCPELKEQLKDLIKDIEKELGIEDPKEKKSEVSNSFDPNMISGPSGVGTNRYINNTDYQSFSISFENLETATAAAQIVRIYDTLDINKYDLSTFSFGSIGIGSKYFRLPPYRKEFAIERNIEQEIPVKVRISGGIDETTGVVTWEFVAIDTTTDQLPVLEGFLPPNVIGPEGEGYVRFMVKPKANLADGTVFENQATIIFDQNEPIATNVWRNVLDIGKPTSTLTATVQQDSIIRLNLNGFDAVSGMGYYNLYVKINNGQWLPFGGTPLDSIIVIGQPDSTYSFYIRSKDKVGNEENKNEGAEVTITLQKPVAITFGSLSAQAIGENTIRLHWNTYHEDLGDYFVIERSDDGRNFIEIDKINAFGKPSVYDYPDTDPGEGNNYYRLKIVNNDGDFSFSNVVVVRSESKPLTSIFPNPVRDRLIIRIPGIIRNTDRLILYNTYGQRVAEKPLTGNMMEIDMRNLPSGVYYLIYKNKDGKGERLRIVRE